MLHSITHLIDDIKAGNIDLKFDDPILESCINRDAQLKDAKKEFASRFCCLQGRYLRSSWMSKLQFVSSLVGEITNLSSLATLLNSFFCISGKLSNYVKAEPSTNFSYDKTFNSHNRSLDEDILDRCQQEDIEWFSSLDGSSQISIIIALVRLGGGSIMIKTYDRLYEMYRLRSEERNNAIRKSKSDFRKSIKESRLSEKLTLLGGMMPDPKYDPNDPVTIQLEKERARFEDVMKKYKLSVDGRLPDDSKLQEDKAREAIKQGQVLLGQKKKKEKKEKKVTIAEKKSKKGKKKQGSDGLDRVQMLPIWIVKKIFTYLDKQSLKNAQSVNKYWDYVVHDLAKEHAARAQVNKMIRKMEDMARNVITHTTLIPVAGNKPRTSATEKRMRKLENRGCIHPSLKLPCVPLCNESLNAVAPKEYADDYLLPVKALQSYPRNGRKYPVLGQRRSLVCIDAGFVRFSETKPEDTENIIAFTLSQHDDETASKGSGKTASKSSSKHSHEY